ncbi:MAG: hypothetical protein PVG39_08160 [Desulfobacteraceae bacterium]|jgi:hypothetical protein
MSRTIDDHLKQINPTGIDWIELTEKQQLKVREEWDAVVSDPGNLSCACPNTSCANNRKCKKCIALHRYYDGVPECLRPLVDKVQASVPQEKKYNVHYKIQADGALYGIVDPTDPDGSRERLMKANTPEKMKKVVEKWAAIIADPENTKCDCPNVDCKYHGNCVKCVALHRYYGGFPHCVRYIIDEIDAIVETHGQAE